MIEKYREILSGKCVTDEACEQAIKELLNLHSVIISHLADDLRENYFTNLDGNMGEQTAYKIGITDLEKELKNKSRLKQIQFWFD
jgi:hypothetical protein